MLIRSVKTILAGTALLLAFALPASAQDKGRFGVGLSFLGDEGGTGVQGSVTGPFKTTASGRALSWIVDGSFHHKSVLEVGWTNILVQGGVQTSGPLGSDGKIEWFGHGMVGLNHYSFADALFGDLCDTLGVDCGGTSGNAILITPGGGVAYKVNDKTSIFGQLDIPIAISGDGNGSTTRFTIGALFKR